MSGPSDISDHPTRSPSRSPSRTPSRTPTRAGKGPARKGPPRVPLPPGTLLKGGAFRIVDVLGEGGFSITYVGLEGSRQVKVAIKELFPLGCVRSGMKVTPANHWDPKSLAAALEDFIAEGKVLKFFTHPGIVQSYTPFEENGTGYLAMEFLEGESLLDGLTRRGPMNQHDALEVARQVGEALAYVHDRDIIHSDIKPENIVFTQGSRFVILDFGVSKRYVPGRSSRAAVVAVSPPYSPPEQYLASKPLTDATDVYGLAATLYTMLACQLPPDAQARQKGARITPLPELNPTVTPQFWKLLETALDLRPENRPQKMRDFVYALTGDPGLPGSPPAAPTEHLRVEKVAEFEAHRGGIYALRVHPHRPLLLSGARNGGVGLWNWPMGGSVGQLKAHDTALAGFALSPDGSLLATAGEPGEVKLWHTETGQMLRVLRNGLPAVSNLSFSQDGQAVAVAMSDGSVHLFTSQQVEPLMLAGHRGPVNAVAFSPDGTLIATAGQDGQIKVWDTQTAGLLRQLEGHTRTLLAIDFSADSRLLLSGASDYTTRLWEIDAGLELRRFREEGANVWSVAFSCDPDLVFSGNADRKIRCYRVSSGRQVWTSEADKNYLRCLVCDARHPLLASGGGDGRIRIWRFHPL